MRPRCAVALLSAGALRGRPAEGATTATDTFTTSLPTASDTQTFTLPTTTQTDTFTLPTSTQTETTTLTLPTATLTETFTGTISLPSSTTTESFTLPAGTDTATITLPQATETETFTAWPQGTQHGSFPKSGSDDEFPKWAIALCVVLPVVAIAIAVGVYCALTSGVEPDGLGAAPEGFDDQQQLEQTAAMEEATGAAPPAGAPVPTPFTQAQMQAK